MWEFRLPTKIVFGEGVADRLQERVAVLGRQCLAVCDRTVANTPAVARALDAAGCVDRFEDVAANPTVGNVNALAGRIRASGADVLAAIGGGSVMDCAKAAAALVTSGGETIEPYHTGGKTLGAEPLPVIAVPTTAGTGSEVTPFAVLDDPDKGVKAPLAATALYPALAMVDSLLTHSMPRFVTACTGLDALSHAMEAYWSVNHQPICDRLAMEAARLVFRRLETVCRNPCDREARHDMSYAALLAGMAFQLPKNAMVHACSFPLSNRFHMPHGAACAFTLEFALRFNAPALGARAAALLDYCDFDSVDAMAAAIRSLKQAGGLPCTLAEADIPAGEIELLVEESFHPLIRNNPAQVTPDDLRRMYAELANG